MLFSGQGPMGSRGRKPCLLYHSWFELCPLGQGTLAISDSRGASPSPSPTPILRAPWMSTALRAEPTRCLACERRDPHIPSPTWELGALLSAAPKTPRKGLAVHCTKTGKEAGHPTLCPPLPHRVFLLQVLVPRPLRASLCGTRLVLEPPSRNQLQKAREQAVLLAVFSTPGGRREEEGLGGVKTTSIALAGTLCDPLQQAE